ncbi:6669_t:CDS:1, partial [Entrophospora sp. SA101]
PLISPIQVPDDAEHRISNSPIPETNPIQIPDSVQVQPTKISSTSDTLFSDQKVEWEYQNVKRKL